MILSYIECGFALKRVHDTTRTYSQMHHRDTYCQHSSIIWPVWLIGWVFVYELSCCRFESSCSHLTFRFRACFEQGVPWHSGECGFTLKRVCDMTRTYSQDFLCLKSCFSGSYKKFFPFGKLIIFLDKYWEFFLWVQNLLFAQKVDFFKQV